MACHVSPARQRSIHAQLCAPLSDGSLGGVTKAKQASGHRFDPNPATAEAHGWPTARRASLFLSPCLILHLALPRAGPPPAAADDQGRRIAQKRGAEDAAPEGEHTRRPQAPRLAEQHLGRPPQVPSSPGQAAFNAEHQAAGPSYLVSARKASKRPAVDQADGDGPTALALNFTPAPPRLGHGLTTTDARPTKRLAGVRSWPQQAAWP